MDIKAIRHKLNLSQATVAKEAGISQNHYCNIEIHRRRPSPQVAVRIAATLGISDDWYRLLEQ